MAVDWNDYKQFDDVIDAYMPRYGEGDSQASQLVTAVNKLVYKSYNDGDVYDNTGVLAGWANDLSSYANWIYKYIPRTRNILDGVYDCYTEDEYRDLLWDLAEETLGDKALLVELQEKDKVGSIYDCKGPYKFVEYDEAEYDAEYDEDEYEEEEIWEDEDEYIESSKYTGSRKPRDWNTMFAVKVIDAYNKGDLDFNNVAEWETRYNGGVRPNPPLSTKEILEYYIRTGEDPRN